MNETSAQGSWSGQRGRSPGLPALELLDQEGPMQVGKKYPDLIGAPLTEP
ncbi:hypothetical protein [Archangium violaceum]